MPARWREGGHAGSAPDARRGPRCRPGCDTDSSGRSAHGLREILQKHRSAEGVTHENGPAPAPQELVNAVSPSPVPRVFRPRHARSQDAISSPQTIPEQRLPVHLASPPSGLTGAVNHEDASRHGRYTLSAPYEPSVTNVAAILSTAAQSVTPCDCHTTAPWPSRTATSGGLQLLPTRMPSGARVPS